MSNAIEALTAAIGADAVRAEEFRGDRRVVVPAEKLHEALRLLKNAVGFDYLVDVAGIDYLGYPDATDRYGVVYALANTTTAERLFVKAYVNDPDPALPTATDLWPGANWMEREVYDMFGVTFTGHPDHRRILMPEEFASFPLRKDYPLRGYGERHNLPTITRAES